ncbi:MAG: bifunctional diaminohydroxyphosphoribosylaminopyrimidine deaminase/5-amino-6-(5-phosphoribosylamino)uracil reductase RibD [Flavobacteriia bacterium]
MDELYMRRCIELARHGMGSVAPNPMVGAVIVHNERIVGEGFHREFGEAHAELNAVNSVAEKALLNESTIYVSLEPCAHHGKTPPCSDLLIQCGFKRVVIGCKDSFSKVSGKGIEKLKKAGIEVVVGVLEQECRDLNKRFFTFHERQRPYVILKWAQSKDGYLDRIRQNEEKGVNWISSQETKVLVHKWRSEEQSILVGRKTVQNDNPSLTVREFSGTNPTRIIIDSQLQLSDDQNIFSEVAPTIIFNRIRNEVRGTIEYVRIAETNTKLILDELYRRNILSVFVEGGSRTLQYFIFGNVWDEARVIVGNTNFYEGTKAPTINKAPTESFQFSTDIIHYYFRK